MLSAELNCPACHWRTIAGEADIARRLRKLGLLRREAEPSEALLGQLLISHGEQLACDNCQAVGLQLGNAKADGDFDDDWQQAVVCEVCREPIPEERLEFMPQATRCVTCQSAEDRGEAPVELDFCPRCGSLMELRTSRGGGITRYKLFCTGSPACRS